MAKKKGKAIRRGGISPQRVKRWLRRLAILAVVAAIGYGLVLLLGTISSSAPGLAVPDRGRGHTPQCSPNYTNNSRPPASGCHSPGQASYGIHEEPIPHELQVHNLEHGAVIIQYRTSGVLGVGDALVEDLRGLVNRLRGEDARYCRLILAPYPFPFAVPGRTAAETDNALIALTAWGRIDLLREYDELRIRKFIDAFINRGLEKVPDCP